MSVLKVEDIAYVRFAAPELARMRAFLEDFGLVCFEHEDGRLYGQARDGTPFSHSTEQGNAAFLGVGFRAADVAALEALAASEGVPIAASDAPGGGWVVRLRDPDGIIVEVVAGQASAPMFPMPAPPPMNSAASKPRTRAAVRLAPGPSRVVRLGHCVLTVSDFRRSEQWYKSRFGFITSDEVVSGPKATLGAFMRCDRGDMPVDHHTLFLAQLPGPVGFNHAAFEVAGLDDLMLGHAHLKAAKHEQAWGVGRHILGSQIFDYWKDPWGRELEHWTDGDLLTAADKPNLAPIADLLAVQWGAPHPLSLGKLAPAPGLIALMLTLFIRVRRLFQGAAKGVAR